MKRPRKAVKTAQRPRQGPNPSTGLDKDSDMNDAQRIMRLERNRAASSKCRVRKRDEASMLASREQAMEDQNRQLSACFDSLRAEICTLKALLLQHTECGCVLIQKYIANEAKKAVDTLVVDPELPTPPQPPSEAVSCMSTATESIQTRSPMTAMAREDQEPSVDGFANAPNAITAQDIDGDQYKQATALSNHLHPAPLAELFLPQREGIGVVKNAQDSICDTTCNPEWQIS
jgi:hypothetical protein